MIKKDIKSEGNGWWNDIPHGLRPVLLCIFCLFSVCLPGVQPFASPATPLVEAELLTKQPKRTLVYSDSLIFSPDMHDIAYVVAREKGMGVIINSKAEKVYDHIARGYPIFSPARNRFGYIADKDGKYFVVIDGKESIGYDGACCLRFSPSGEHAVFIAQDKNKQFVVLNGNRLKPYDMIDQVTGVVFSPDAQSIIYLTRNKSEKGARIIINGKESELFDSIKEISFSPDAKKTAYSVSQNNAWYVIHDGFKKGPYDKAAGLTWSSDSVHLAHIAIKDKKFWVIDNNDKIPAGDFVPQNIFFQDSTATNAPHLIPPIFSPDASQMAFSRIEGEKFRNVIGKKTGPLFDRVGMVVFSPDSRHYAYLAVIRTPAGVKMKMIHDGTIGNAYDMIDEPVFSPDSKTLIYRAMAEGKWLMVKNGRAGKPFGVVGRPIFSPDSQKLAYPAQNRGKWYMITDGKPQKAYDAMGLPVFSPDSKKLAYRAMDNNKLIMVVNNKEATYEIKQQPVLLESISRPIFSPDGKTLAYLIKTDNQLESLLALNETTQKITGNFFPEMAQPIIFSSHSQARLLTASFDLEKKLYEIYRINITLNSNPHENRP